MNRRGEEALELARYRIAFEQNVVAREDSAAHAAAEVDVGAEIRGDLDVVERVDLRRTPPRSLVGVSRARKETTMNLRPLSIRRMRAAPPRHVA